MTKLEMAVQCCLGRVGRRLFELAQKNDSIAKFVAPTGVDLLREAGKTGLELQEAINCCNGRVGKRLNVQELMSSLTGATD